MRGGGTHCKFSSIGKSSSFRRSIAFRASISSKRVMSDQSRLMNSIPPRVAASLSCGGIALFILRFLRRLINIAMSASWVYMLAFVASMIFSKTGLLNLKAEGNLVQFAETKASQETGGRIVSPFMAAKQPTSRGRQRRIAMKRYSFRAYDASGSSGWLTGIIHTARRSIGAASEVRGGMSQGTKQLYPPPKAFLHKQARICCPYMPHVLPAEPMTEPLPTRFRLNPVQDVR